MSAHFAWLIERKTDAVAEWWTGEPGEDWTRDAYKAAWFATGTAAAATMRALRLGGYSFVTEHGFEFASPDTGPRCSWGDPWCEEPGTEKAGGRR